MGLNLGDWLHVGACSRSDCLYGELKSGKRNAAIINAIMGLFFKIGFTIGGAIPRFGYWPPGKRNWRATSAKCDRRNHYDRGAVDAHCVYPLFR